MKNDKLHQEQRFMNLLKNVKSRLPTSDNLDFFTKGKSPFSADSVFSVSFSKGGVADMVLGKDKKILTAPRKSYTNYTNYTKYINFIRDSDPLILVLWNLGTFMHDLFDYYPLIVINAPKASGKTQLCTLIALTSWNGKIANSISSSALFRIIDSRADQIIPKPTIIIDDMEIMSNKERAEDINGILRACWFAGGTSTRTNPNTLLPEEFRVFTPVAISNIRGLSDDALESRAIHLHLLRSKNKEILNRDVSPRGNQDTKQMYENNLRWAYNHHRKVHEVYRTLEPEEGINGRHWQMWKPILSIARVMDETNTFNDDLSEAYPEGYVYNLVRSYALEKIKEFEEEDTESIDVRFLQSMKDIVTEEGYYSLKHLKNQCIPVMFEGDETPRWFNNWFISRLLKRLGLNKEKRRVSSGNEYFLSPAMVEDVLTRYVKKVKQ